MRRFFGLLVCLLLARPFMLRAADTTYYVDTAADAGGDGTTTALTGANCAFKTLAQVNAASFSAGDSILFKRGCTWREVLAPPSAGGLGNLITFGSYGTGDKPILSGLALKNGAGDWTQYEGSATLSLRPATGTDDGYFGVNYEAYDTDASNLTTGDYAFQIFVRSAFIRFPNVTIPQGATISAATITFRALGYIGQGEEGTAATIFKAIKETNATAPTSKADALGRTLTTESVTWAVSEWTSGTDYESPDLADVIQEIVDQGEWSSGNAIVVYFADNGSPAGIELSMTSRDGSATLCPRLSITYSTGVTDNWYLSTVTSDPVMLLHDGVLGSATQGGNPRKTSLGALAADWDYYYDSDADRLYVMSSGGNPTGEATNLEIGSLNPLDAISANYLKFDGLRISGSLSTAALVWGATGVEFEDCDFVHIGRIGIQFNNGASGSVTDCTFTDWNISDYNGGFAVHVIKNGATQSGPVNVTGCTMTMVRASVGNQVAAIVIDDGGKSTDISDNTISNIYVGAGISVYNPGDIGTLNIHGNTLTNVRGISIEATGLEENGATPTINIYRNSITNSCLADTIDTEAMRLRGFTTSSTVSIYYNIINGTHDGSSVHHGIQVKGADGARIWNNVIYGCDNGIEVNDDAADHSTGLDVRNNLVFGNRGYGLNLGTDNTITVWGSNCWYDNDSGALNGKAAGAGDITASPCVVLPGTDFIISSISPCINTGADVGLGEDYFGNSVPDGRSPDIGVHEYQTPSNPGRRVVIIFGANPENR